MHVGVAAGFSAKFRRELLAELEPRTADAMQGHPWQDWAEWQQQDVSRKPGATSRWNAGKDLSWVPIRIEKTCEVSYDHLQGSRFRHGTHFKRWRPDKPPSDCRYDQLEVSPPYELAQIFGGRITPISGSRPTMMVSVWWRVCDQRQISGSRIMMKQANW